MYSWIAQVIHAYGFKFMFFILSSAVMIALFFLISFRDIHYLRNLNEFRALWSTEMEYEYNLIGLYGKVILNAVMALAAFAAIIIAIL